jgi:RNA polymerase sigma factor (sigma-70 family)
MIEIIKHLNLVKYVARTFKGKGLEYDDLVQEGTLGLLEAARRFNPDLGFKFSSYATKYIRNRILDALLANTGNIHVPTHIIATIKSLNRGDIYYNNLKPRQQKAIKAGLAALSEMVTSEGVLQNIMDYRAANNYSDLVENLKSLHLKHIDIIIKYHGLDGNDEQTFREISKETGHSQTFVHKKYQQTMELLKENALLRAEWNSLS